MNTSFKPAKDQSLFSRVFFFCSIPLFIRSLLEPIRNFSHLRSSLQMDFLLKRYQATKSHQHRYKLLQMFKLKIIVAGICAIISGIIIAICSLIIRRLLGFISSPLKSTTSAYYDLIYWTVLSILKMFLLQNSYRMFSEVGVACEMITQSKILSKVADIPLNQKHGIMKSQVLGVFIMQVKRIHSFFKIAKLVCLSPTSFILALGLIFWQNIYLGLVVAHTIVFILTILYFINVQINKAKGNKMKQQRIRISTNIQLVSQLKQLKNLGWQQLLYKRTSNCRQQQNKLNAEVSYLNEIYQLLIILIPVVVFALMFIFDYMSGNVGQITYMNVAQIYILINYVNMLHSPLKSIRVIVASFDDLRTAFNRIQAFFEIKSNIIKDNSDKQLEIGTLKIKNLTTINTSMSNKWSQKVHRQQKIQNPIQLSTQKQIQMTAQKYQVQGLEILFDINIKRGQKLIILDSSNQGSTLLASIAGHLKSYSGILSYNGKLGYVPYKYYFSPNSIKDNIVFGSQFSKKLLEQSIYNADLSEQLKMYNLQQNTIMTEETFSVSQLNRISYARTLYTRPDIVLLDDTFNTMNRATIQALNNRMKLKLSNVTFIIATNSLYSIQETDHILIFEGGKAIEYGTYVDLLKNKNSNIHKFVGVLDSVDTQQNIVQHRIIKQKQKRSHIVYGIRRKFRQKYFIKNLIKTIREKGVGQIHHMIDEFHKLQQKNNKQNSQSVEQIRYTKDTTISFYRKLFSYSPKNYMTIAYTLIVLSQSIMMFLNWFRGYMARPSQQVFEIRNTIWYFTLTLIYIIVYFIQSSLDVKSVQQACDNIGQKMMHSISKSSPIHFQNAPLTVTTDKLNQDYSKIFNLFSKFSHVIRNAIMLFGAFILITFESPLFFLYAIPLAVFNIGSLIYLHRYANQVASQHSSFSSASLSSVERVFDGIQTYKFYGNPSKFVQDQFPNFYNYGVYRTEQRQSFHLISFLSQISSIFIITYIAYHAITSKSIMSSARIVLLGSCISHSIKVSGILNNINRQLIEAQCGIIKNIKKIFDYIQLKPQENYDKPPKPQSWPKIPSVQIQNVTIKKSKHIHRSLKQICLKVKPQQRIVIFGRGTSGIYSVFPALMKQSKPIINKNNTKGYIKVGGIDITNIGKKYILEQFFHITPNPFIFTSTLVDNIDPFSEFPHHQILKLLNKLNIKHFIPCKQSDLLQYPIVLSQTIQPVKHIINVTRGILRSPSLLLCESIQTLNGIEVQSLISKQLNYSTIMFINPHLNFIKQANRIVFLSHGRIVENDTPFNIFQKNQSQFTKTIQQSHPIQFSELKKRVSFLSSQKSSPLKKPQQ